MVGTEIGNFRILEKIGAGGMGVVYKALDVSLDRVVAMKALSANLLQNPDLERRFRVEARAQASLNHPNLATIHAFLVHNEQAWMVMEFIDGVTFDQMLRQQGPIPSEHLIPLFRQALAGIGCAHRAGIVHRDIKPGNIMVNRDRIVKVMDFGIAKVIGNQSVTRTGTVVGTASYMSPEQVLCQGLDARSDIYSLGVTLYQMLTARLPFEGDSDFQIMEQHLHAAPPLLTEFRSDIPEHIQHAVLRALAKEPDARFQNTAEFSSAFEVGFAALMEATADPSPQPTPGVGTEPRAGPTRKAAFGGFTQKTGIGLACTALALAAGWFFLRPAPEPAVSHAATSAAPPAVPPQKPQTPPAPVAVARIAPPSSPKAPPQLLLRAGTPITVELNEGIDSAKNQPPAKFAASVDSPVPVGSQIAIPKGATARVQMVSPENADPAGDRRGIVLQLITLTVRGASYTVRSLPLKEEPSRHKKNPVGVVLGGIIGADGATQKKANSSVILAPSTKLRFVLRSPLTVAGVAGQSTPN
jgi:serine/threonine-protein kinase